MTENKITNSPQPSSLAEREGAAADPLEAPMQRDPNEAARDRYWLTGPGREVLERDAAMMREAAGASLPSEEVVNLELRRVARYQRRLRQVDAVIEHSREVMVDYAKRLGEAMALRERIVRELSQPLPAEQGSAGTRVGVGDSKPGESPSAGSVHDACIPVGHVVPGGRPIPAPVNSVDIRTDPGYAGNMSETSKLSGAARTAIIEAEASRQGAQIAATGAGIVAELRAAGLIGAGSGLTRKGVTARERLIAEALDSAF